MPTLETILTENRDAWTKLDKLGATGAGMLEDFVLRNGQAYQGQKLPAKYRKRTAKMCFYNTWQVVRASKTLRYVEGYALNRSIGHPFHHAWAITPKDEVIDTTVEDHKTGISIADNYEYFGVIFHVLNTEWRYSGMLLNEMEMIRVEWLGSIDPGWKARHLSKM